MYKAYFKYSNKLTHRIGIHCDNFLSPLNLKIIFLNVTIIFIVTFIHKVNKCYKYNQKHTNYINHPVLIPRKDKAGRP